MARRNTYQKPEPYEENGQWKIKYRMPIEQEDGSIRREQRTKCLGSVAEMNINESRKGRDRFLQPINDAQEGIEHSRKTIGHLLARWRDAVKPTIKLSTQLQYEWAFKRIEPAFNGQLLVGIGKEDVQSFLTGLGGTLAPRSIKDLRICLCGILTAAVEWSWITRNPAAGKMKMPKGTVRKKIVLAPEQFWRLVGGLKPPHSTTVLLAVLSGLRRGEIAALRNDDLQGAEVVVDEAVYRGVLDDPKTPRSRRRVAIGPEAQRAMREWIAMARFKGPREFIFGVRKNTPFDAHNSIARHVKPACDRLSIPRVSWHDFRHTFTTWGRRKGVEPEALRDQLGHTTVQMTMDVYSHIDGRAQAAQLVEEYAGRSPQAPPPAPGRTNVIAFPVRATA